MDSVLLDKLRIREVVQNWAVWRDAGDWERFRSVWHKDGRMMATWFQGPAADLTGRRVAFLEGWSSDRGLVASAIRILDLASGKVSILDSKEAANVTAIQWRDGESLWFAGWHHLGSAYRVIGLDGRVQWSEREDAIIGPTSFLAQKIGRAHV